MTTYLCKYTPVELLLALGCSLTEPNEEVRDFSDSDALIHSSVCSHAKQLLTVLIEENGADCGAACEECEGGRRELILTNCCDSIRRVADIAEAEENLRFDYLRMLELPHRSDDHSVKLFAGELLSLLRDYEALGRTFDRGSFLRYWQETHERWIRTFSDDAPCIAVMGARAGDQLLARLESALPYHIVDLTCGGARYLDAAPAEGAAMELEALMEAYAKTLLTQIPCMRMEQVGARCKQMDKPGLRGIVYHTVRFCDYYSFEYARITRQSALPILKIESDYTVQSEGQMSTRITAFAESLRTESEEPLEKKERPKEACYIGIDSGSTTTNVVAIDSEGAILASRIVRTGARAGESAARAVEEIRQELGPERAAVIRGIMATGYGREFIDLADGAKTEITCHAKGAHAMDPKVRTIIDIGGQDSKVICLDEQGNVTNFLMNDKCAAGTGRFLEMMARTLEMELPEMAKRGLKWDRDLTISSVCTVFAESEVVSLIAQSTETDDIVHALSKSVASKTCSMVKRSRGQGPYMMTGGVARNSGVVREIETRLGEKLHITADPDLIGAYGAALFAAETL